MKDAPDPEIRRPRLAAAALMALSSALLFTVFVFEDISAFLETSLADVPWGLVLRYAMAMAVAGAIFGALLARFLGREGLWGWVLSLVVAVVIATIAGVLGSLLGRLPTLLSGGPETRDLIAIAAGALVLIFAVAEWPIVGALWLGLVALSHVLLRNLRRKTG